MRRQIWKIRGEPRDRNRDSREIPLGTERAARVPVSDLLLVGIDRA
jgi:hypothetical protein